MVAQGDGEGTAEACPLVGPASKLVSWTGPCMPHAISALSMCSIKDSMRQTVM